MLWSETTAYKQLQNLDEEARSKTQRRLFAMALMYKRGKLDSKYHSDAVIKLSKLPEKTLHDFAATNQKRRRKDGSIGKRNNIPQRVKKSKNK